MARQRKGLRQEDAAKVIGAARTTLIAIEKGERRITAKELFDLAEAYGCQMGDLIRKWEKFSDELKTAISQEETETATMRVLLELLDLSRRYVELERLNGVAPLPCKVFPEHHRLVQFKPAMNDEELYRAANGLAGKERRWGLCLTEEPLPLDLRECFEPHYGLRIFHFPFPKELKERGYLHFYDANLGGCVAVNSENHILTQRWFLAEALLHFLIKNVPDGLGHEFAKFFLAPPYGLAEAYRLRSCPLNHPYTSLGVEEKIISSIALEYGVTSFVVTENLGLCGFWGKDPSYTKPFGMFPQRYLRLAAQAWEAGKISQAHLAQYLRCDSFDAKELAEQTLEAL